MMKPTPARAPGSVFPLEIFSLGHQVPRALRRFWSAGLAASLGGGSLAFPRSPSHAARTVLQGARTGGAHQGSEPYPVPGPGHPAKLQGCHSRARLSAYLPCPHASPDGARRTFQPSAQGLAALVARNPRPEPLSPRCPPASAGIQDASSRSCSSRAQPPGAAPSGGDGLGRALRGRRAAGGQPAGASRVRNS